MLIMLFTIAFGVPMALWVYRTLLAKVIKAASAKVKDISKKLKERISDAGRRISERARM
jgi:hypothetical protein